MSDRIVSAVEEAGRIEAAPEGARALRILRRLAAGTPLVDTLGAESEAGAKVVTLALRTLIEHGAVTTFGPDGFVVVTDKGRRVAEIVDRIEGGVVGLEIDRLENRE